MGIIHVLDNMYSVMRSFVKQILWAVFGTASGHHNGTYQPGTPPTGKKRQKERERKRERDSHVSLGNSSTAKVSGPVRFVLDIIDSPVGLNQSSCMHL